MPARIIEELASRKKEKIATFLTFESIVAVIVAFMPIFMISAQWPLLTRVPVCAAAILAGYIAAAEFRGLPLYEHVLWSARGLFRLRTQGSRVVPEDLPGAIPAPDRDRVIAASGPIELVQHRPVAATRPLATPVARVERPTSILVVTDAEPLDARDEALTIAASDEGPTNPELVAGTEG